MFPVLGNDLVHWRGKTADENHAGMAIGIASSVVPVYQSEICQKEIRGRVVSLQQWAITWGILIQYFIQYGSSFVSTLDPM